MRISDWSSDVCSSDLTQESDDGIGNDITQAADSRSRAQSLAPRDDGRRMRAPPSVSLEPAKASPKNRASCFGIGFSAHIVDSLVRIEAEPELDRKSVV